VDLDPRVLEVLRTEYTNWKILPDGRIAAVSNAFTYGKYRIVVGVDYAGYSDGY
jgi:hypothetical protein